MPLSCTGQISHKDQLYPGQHLALIDAETWAAVRDQIVGNASGHQRKTKAAKPSLLAGLLVDVRGERLTPTHAVKKGRCYRYYVSAALITEAGTERNRELSQRAARSHLPPPLRFQAWRGI